MNRPDNIPEDVWTAASAALLQSNIKAHMLAEPTDPLECISLAIIAERERCRTAVYEPLAHDLTNARYMLEAYRSMLGEIGLKVVAMWKAKNVKRVHHSWGPGAAALTGEQRAALILEWEEAGKNGVLVENIDGPEPTPPIIPNPAN